MNRLKTIIKEEYNNIMDEDYPASFDMEYFKTLSSYKKRIEYATEHLHRLSSGSSRIVFKIDDEKVLKLAYNRKGLAQNETEIEFSNDSYINHIFADTFDYHPDFLWLEMELCKKLNYVRFQELTGLRFVDFSDMIRYEHSRINSRGGGASFREPDNYDDFIENEFLGYIIDYIGNFDIPYGDLIRISTYGENSKNEVVLVDYGLTNDVASTYYS